MSDDLLREADEFDGTVMGPIITGALVKDLAGRIRALEEQNTIYCDLLAASLRVGGRAKTREKKLRRHARRALIAANTAQGGSFQLHLDAMHSVRTELTAALAEVDQ